MLVAFLLTVGSTVEVCAREFADFGELLQAARDARLDSDFKRAENLYERALNRRPEHPGALFGLGLVLGFRGAYEEAAAKLRRAIEAAPTNPGPKLALARVRYWQGDTHRARAALAPLLDDPGKRALEVHRLAGRIALAAGRPARAEAHYREALAHDGRDSELRLRLGDALAQQGKKAAARAAYRRARALGASQAEGRLADLQARRWRLDFAYQISDLTNGRGTWHRGLASLSYQLDDTLSLRARQVTEDRGFARDTTFAAGAVGRPVPWLILGGDIGVTPSDDFAARFQTSLRGDVRVSDGAGFLGESWLLLNAGHEDFDGKHVFSLKPGVRQGFLSDRLQLSARAIAIHDEDAEWLSGWQMRVSGQPLARVHIYAGTALAPETESRGPTDATRFVTIDTRSFFGGVRWRLSNVISTRLDLLYNDREDSYERQAINVGITFNF